MGPGGRTKARGRTSALVEYDQSVFVNVPFDARYLKLFHALVFAIHDCGFISRCALESDDGSEVRFDKLVRIIQGCRFGIHDISRTTLDARNRLPRFNMPLELGLFLGAKRFGDAQQREKTCLILDHDRYRYQVFCSDIAGQDIRAHRNDPGAAIGAVRDWLRGARAQVSVPGGKRLSDRYVLFRTDLPKMCLREHLTERELTFLDYRALLVGWLEANPEF